MEVKYNSRALENVIVRTCWHEKQNSNKNVQQRRDENNIIGFRLTYYYVRDAFNLVAVRVSETQRIRATSLKSSSDHVFNF